MHPLNRKIQRDLVRLRGQSLAIALIVASGVGVLVMSLAAMQAMTDTAAAYYERYQFADIFGNATRAPLQVLREIEALPGVRIAEGRIVKYATIDIESFAEPIAGVFNSLPTHFSPKLNQLALRAGRMPLAIQTEEVLISEPFAEAHNLLPGDTFKALLNGRKRSLKIVGIALSPEFVYAIGPGTLMPDAARYGVVWMGEEALAAAFDLEHAFNNVAVSLWPDASLPQTLRSIDLLLDNYGGTGAIARADQISNWFVMNEIKQLRSIATILPPIFLAVAAFLTNMVLARLVYIERAEIGLLKAFGYSNATMAWHYTKFVIVISSLGVLLGWLLGFWLGRLMTTMYADLFRFPLLVYAPDLNIYFLSAFISITTALIGALAAARYAAFLPPAEAMRPSSPPQFRHHTSGINQLLKRIDQPTRIIFRQVLRRPLRTLLTSLGVAASVAVLITSLQWLDAIDYIIADYFNTQQRQDMTIALVESEKLDVRNELMRLPGVQAIEAHRAVAARLHFGARQRREALMGLPLDSQLEVLHDVSGSRVALPSAGLLMSTAMADILGVQVGDKVIVEVLQGRRPTLSIPVAAVFETLVGTPVYMNIEPLNRALHEPEQTNLLLALFDQEQQPRLLSKLKDIPAVAGVVLKRAAITLFNQTIAETMLIMIFFYVAFASTLSFGVLYNNMRISLSERGRELATLRVLGFTKAEIAYMLFGEAAVLTLLGLPIGCLLGWLLSEYMAQAFNNELFRLPVVIAPATYAYSMLVVIGSAIASALFIERRLARLNLVSVLKTRE